MITRMWMSALLSMVLAVLSSVTLAQATPVGL